MKTTRKTLTVAAWVMAACLSAVWAAPAGNELRIYLPAEVHVACDALDLGGICIIRGDDEAAVRKASAVAMGRAPWSKERITVDRPTILARLASGGIDASAVRFTGSEKIIVCRDEKIVPAEEILKAAEALLQEKRPGPPGCSWKLARAVEDLAVPMSRGVRLRADLAKDTPASGPAAAVLERVKVEVQALSGTAELARCEAVFKVLYPAQQAVATKDIAPGAALTQENIRIEAVTTEAKPAEGWTAPFGLIAVKAVPAGAVVRPAFVQPPRPVILVKRNQSVTMRIIGSGFVVTALGEAMEDGRGGDVIKVRNADTRRVVVARVNFDGSVEPVMGESGR